MEIDDAYLGGERSGGKAGRGSENKVPFVAAVQTAPDGQPQFVCLHQQPFTTEAVAAFAAHSIAPSATVVSDGLWCFGAVQRVGAEHERVVTGGGKVSTALPRFKAVNTFLGTLKRSLGGTYHAFDFAKYAHRYLAEAQYRFNRRFNLETAVAGSAKRRKANIGAAFRAIPGTAEQFLMGDRPPSGIFRRDSNLASFDGANCRF